MVNPPREDPHDTREARADAGGGSVDPLDAAERTDVSSPPDDPPGELADAEATEGGESSGPGDPDDGAPSAAGDPDDGLAGATDGPADPDDGPAGGADRPGDLDAGPAATDGPGDPDDGPAATDGPADPDDGPAGAAHGPPGAGDPREPGAARRPLPPWPPDERRGERVIQGDVWATATFAATSLAAALVPDPLEVIAVPVHLVLFVAGCATFLWAYAIAIGRSRYEVLTMAGLFFLADRVAPQRVTRSLRTLLAIQVVVALVVAAARPFTALAFAVLVPMLGLGNMALWSARYGTFPPKPDATD